MTKLLQRHTVPCGGVNVNTSITQMGWHHRDRRGLYHAHSSEGSLACTNPRAEACGDIVNISLELSNFFKGGQNSDLDSMREQVYDELFLPLTPFSTLTGIPNLPRK